ncbi:hypothetical protein niasHT_025566 [Heterodera trifolii]|uniref:FAM91 N-terminal domain-containing protein n=1 Tax=Heterodera trifolii TaxID=157864 RepID=A0ABD2K894_9BILA
MAGTGDETWKMDRDGIPVCFVKRFQEEYYDSLLSYNQQRMMLYPYHLSDILVCELRITPFTSLTLTSCACWASVATSTLTSPEQQIINRLLDEGSICCGLLDKGIVLRLLSRGLVYLEVPIGSDDYVFVPTLDGFMMNRVQGDYFETLLYKIFVAIDGQTSVMELADTIGIDINLVKNAVSVFCRLGFARKRVTGIENVHLHASWTTGDYANADTTGTTSSVLASPSSDQLSVISANAQLADLSMALLSTTGEDGTNATGTDDDIAQPWKMHSKDHRKTIE